MDYKVKVNPSLQIEQYPLPCLISLQHTLLDNESSKLVTINTHQGLCECCRLPFGLASAPTIFKHAMDLKIQFVICYLDDILITGRSPAEHLQMIARCLSA